MSGKRGFEIDEDQFAALLKDAVLKVKTEEDPIVLTEYKKIFKKNVPLTLRSYVAAYLAKNACGGYKHRNRRDRNNMAHDRRNNDDYSRNRGDDGTERQKMPRVVIAEEDAATIFVGIGRNRHVFPRDLVGLISQVVQIERERIGTIKVLDNYSFVQLYKEDTDKVISVLNGYEYRGRKLVVSYSKKREDAETESENLVSSENTSVDNGSSVSDTSSSESSSGDFLV